MSKRIGIIGAGTAGLHLGLYLRQHDVEATIITDRAPEAYVGARLPNTVAHHAVTIERERALGVDHWPGDEYGYFGHHYYIGLQPDPLRFYGDLHAPSRAVDYRIYQPRLMEDFAARGGKIEYRQISHDDIPSLASQHYPTCAERIDEREFDLANGPLDILQGGVTPTVRASHIVLDDGTVAIALGDVQATVDPVLGQGANMASHGGWILAEEIVAQDTFDERFVERVELRRRDRVLSATRWTNFMLDNLRLLPPEFQAFIGAVSQSRSMADEFTDNFNYPERQWDIFADGPRVEVWISRHMAAAAVSQPVPVG